jgi:Raf kinase inhibitor-like YbhB/YbcL family protein
VDRTAAGRARPARRAGFARLTRRTRRLGTAVVALCCAAPLSGCGLFSSQITITSPAAMAVSSGAFQRDIMPARFTCAGAKALTPPLSWAGAPAGTKSIAVVVDDSDAPITPYVYWIVFNIGRATSTLLEGQLPPGAQQALNSAGRAGYDPPCPGSSSHEYRFTVYALNTTLNLPNGAPLEKTWQDIAAATIGRGRLSADATS